MVDLSTKAKKIKLIGTDIDGVWTDARMYVTPEGEWMKAFSTYDGMATAMLKKKGIIVAILQISAIAIFQFDMLLLYVIVLCYLLLMGVEFFVPEWLKKRQLIYITSHMVIIPLIDIYASGLDWLLDGSKPHWGLAWFFCVSYVNGLVLEVLGEF